MLSEEDLEYHQQRALAELDQANRAERHVAAEAHMALAGLHMDRIRQQDESCSGSFTIPRRAFS